MNNPCIYKNDFHLIMKFKSVEGTLIGKNERDKYFTIWITD